MSIKQRRTPHRTARWLALLAGAAIVSGCSTLESVNPFSTSDTAEAEEDKRQTLVAKGEENADKLDTEVEDSGEYPNLATVPNAPESGMSPNQRLVVEEGLLADRENAQYVSGPPPKLLPRSGGEMPAAPSEPVESADLPARFSSEAQAPESPDPSGSSASSAPSASDTGPEQSAAVPPGEQVMLVSIRFPEGATETPAQVDQVLEQVALIQQQENAFLRVVGHTAAGVENKDALSTQRAELIASRLRELGAEPTKVNAEGLGDAEPVAEGDDPQANRQNDRVEIFMIR